MLDSCIFYNRERKNRPTGAKGDENIVQNEMPGQFLLEGKITAIKKAITVLTSVHTWKFIGTLSNNISKLGFQSEDLLDTFCPL